MSAEGSDLEGDDTARRRRSFDPRIGARVSYAFTLLLAVVIGIASVGVWNVGVTTTYPLRQAIEWNWRARATNNLVDMATNLNRSIALLVPFQGNPAWVFPTPDTDMDQIRLNLIESRDTALAVAATETIGSFGYQQAVQNLQETIIEINDHLALAKGYYVRSQGAAVLALLYVAFSVFGVLSGVGVRTVNRRLGNRALAVFRLVWTFGSIAAMTLLLVLP